MNAINSLEYYADLSAEDYYHSGGEPEGQWAGLVAHHLNLHGNVSTTDYLNVFRGYDPAGSPICGNPGEGHRPGWDLTFSAPKSVSVLWARADSELRQKIQNGQFRAVSDALRFLEDHAAVTRRGHAGQSQEAAVGLVASLFEHSTSRAQDPQLHTHCLIANVALRNDGSWGTLESRCLFLWGKAAGAVYRAALANQMREIGFDVERVKDRIHFEIEGVSQDICKHFSKRSESIEAELEKLGVNSSASKVGDLVKLTTRSYKKQVERNQLFECWQRELDEKGFCLDQIDKLRNVGQEAEKKPIPLSVVVEKTVGMKSIVLLQDIYAAIAEEAQFHRISLREVEATVDQLVRDGRYLHLGEDQANNDIYSTPEMIAAEQSLVQLIDSLQGRGEFRLNEHVIQRAISSQNQAQGFCLSEELAEAVFGVCQSSFGALQGAAGAGKTLSMKAVRLAYEGAGFGLIGAAVSRQAASQMQLETGIPSVSVAKLLLEIESGSTQLAGKVVVIDEAGQLPTLDLLTVAEAVEAAKAKLILVGEDRQLDAINHAGSLAYFSQRNGCVRIEAIRRQRTQWARECVMHLREGDAPSALKICSERGLLEFSDDANAAREALLNKWSTFIQANPEKETLVVAQKWRDVNKLNASIREIYRSQGRVGKEEVKANCVVGKNYVQLPFSMGDVVRFTRNDYARGFTNGDKGVVEQVERLEGGGANFRVRCESGREVFLSSLDYCDEDGNLHLVHAYASTVYASQGMTVDGDVFVYYTSGMDRSATYVAGSRHKDSCHWFVNRQEIDALSGVALSDHSTDEERVEALAREMSRVNRPSLAIEFLETQDHSISKVKDIQNSHVIANERAG